MWLKTHMDIYILRWGLLWVFTVLVAILASDEEIPDLLYALILAATVMSAFGLAVMLRIYRRASKAVRG
jgi:hypothetical protein